MPRKSTIFPPRQQRFIEEYLIDLNGAQAAIRAGYSPGRARQQASYLLGIPAIRRAVDRAQEMRSERTRVSQDMVLEELARIAFTDMADFAEWSSDGITLKPSAALSEDQTRAVAEVHATKTRDGGTVKFKLHDKRSALADLGRHLGMFLNRHEHTGKDGKPILIEDVATLDDLERAHRIAAILERARARRDGQAADGGDAGMGAADGESAD